MRVTVAKKVSFDAAHYLPGYEGKCKRMHGHHWVVELAVEGPVNNKTGMVMDFSRLSSFLEDNVVKVFDHQCINDIVGNPTAEIIAEYISESCGWLRVAGLELAWIRVWETENSMVELRR